MSRPLRIEYPGAWYHVMNRGRRKEDIFLNKQDYETFIQLLQETTESWGLKVASYCLMSNYYHLLVQTPEGNLSRCMRHLNGVYTQRFNRIHNEDGQLFRGRYKSVLVESDGHLLEVMRYIHRNPLRAGIVEQLADYPWSSHHGYLSDAQKWAWLQRDVLWSMFGGRASRRASYIHFVSKGEPAAIERFYSMKNLPSLLGNNAFKEWVKMEFARSGPEEEIPEARQLAATPIEIIACACKYFELDQDRLMKSKRGKENRPRDIAIYLTRLHSRMTLAEIGGYFGIRNYSTVSSAVERVKARKDQDSILSKDLEKIISLLRKGQR